MLKKEANNIISLESSKMYNVKPRGHRKRLALMICNMRFSILSERHGADCDIIAMRNLLEGLGYEVHAHTNLTAEVMLEKMKQFASRDEHSDSDSTFIVLMSHGERDIVCGINSENITHPDGKEETTDILKIDDIFSTFNNKNCAKLRGKPKVILIQACRGKEAGRVLASDSTQKVDKEKLESDLLYIQKETDFICFCSTTPDTVSYRDPKKGSLFILSLMESIKKHAHCSPLEDIFREVKSSFQGKLQMPTSERNTLTKKFYLLPGY
uniref:Caspase-1 n=2 Tax=Leptobrachium leishanense TaxID=445787 RepID=A0A8C5QX22_9ANUR